MKTLETYLNRLHEITKELNDGELLIKEISGNSVYHNKIDSLINLRQSNKKMCIINLYTCWESYVKNISYEVLVNHQDLLNTSELFIKISEIVARNNYLAKDFYDISNNKMILTKDILVNSNNVQLKSVMDIFLRLGFDKNDFEKHAQIGLRFHEFENMKLIDLEDVKGNCPIVEVDAKDNLNIPTDSHEILKIYYEQIYLLVKTRNKFAHLDKIDQIWSINEIISIAQIIESLMITINEFIRSQLIKKYEQIKIDVFKRIQVTAAFPQINVLEIDPLDEIKMKDISSIEFLALDRNLKIYRDVRIKKMKNANGNLCKLIPTTGKCSIELYIHNPWILKVKKEKLFIYLSKVNISPLHLVLEIPEIQ